MSRRFNVSKLSFAGESLDTTVNQQNQQQAEIVKEAAAKEAEKEITPLIEPDQSANPDPSVSGQPGPNGDSSVNGEKPTAGIDSGNAEFTSALEELENELGSAIDDVHAMIDSSDNTERLSAIANSVESPTENELALINLAADIGTVSETDEHFAAESIDEVRTLIQKRHVFASESILSKIGDIFAGITSHIKGMAIKSKKGVTRINELIKLLQKYAGKKFKKSIKPNNLNFKKVNNGVEVLNNTATWSASIKDGSEFLEKYINVVGQGLTYMTRDFDKSLKYIFSADTTINELAKTEYNNFLDKMVKSVITACGMKDDGSYEDKKVYSSGYDNGCALVKVTYQEIDPKHIDNPSIYTNAIRLINNGVYLNTDTSVKRDAIDFDVDVDAIINMLTHFRDTWQRSMRIFETQFLPTISNINKFLSKNKLNIPESGNLITNVTAFVGNAQLIATKKTFLGKLMTAIAQLTFKISSSCASTLIHIEHSLSTFVTSIATSKEIRQ